MTLPSQALHTTPTADATRAHVTPDRATVRRLFEQGDLVPVYRTLLADLETPVSVFLKLTQSDSVSFLLESVEGGEQIGRYSFLGVQPKGVLTVQGNAVRVTRNGNTVERALAPGEDALHAIAREFERVHPVKLDGLIAKAREFMPFGLVPMMINET